MKVSIKPLKGEVFEIECELETKVGELKKMVEAIKPDFTADAQKLIFSGRILADDNPVQEYGIKAGDQIVVMVAKAKPKAAPAPPEGAAAAPAAAEATPMDTGAAPAAAPAAGGAEGEVPAAAMTALNELKNNPRFNELSRVILSNPPILARMLPALAGQWPHIMTAIRDHPRTFMRMLQESVGAGGGGGDDPMGGAGAGGLAGITGSPQFQQLAQMVAQNPEMLTQMLPALEQSDPAAARAIRENPEAFARMLQQAAGGGGGGGGGGMPGGPGGQQVIQLSESDGAAIARLQDLGFDREACAQAYLACDKNEELAANYLFEHGNDATD